MATAGSPRVRTPHDASRPRVDECIMYDNTIIRYAILYYNILDYNYNIQYNTIQYNSTG